MPSPFPGMDPYLEGYLWPDVHSALASKIRQTLIPLLPLYRWCLFPLMALIQSYLWICKRC